MKYYKVKLRGVQEAITGISKEAGEQLKKQFVDFINSKRKDDKGIEIKNISTRLSAIDWIDLDTTTKDYKKEDTQRNSIDREYSKYHKEKRERTAEVKAKDFKIFELLYFTHRGDFKIKDEVKNTVEKIQLKFFKENPKRIYPDPILFRAMFKHKSTHSEDTEALVRYAPLRIVTSLVEADKRELK